MTSTSTCSSVPKPLKNDKYELKQANLLVVRSTIKTLSITKHLLFIGLIPVILAYLDGFVETHGIKVFRTHTETATQNLQPPTQLPLQVLDQVLHRGQQLVIHI